MNGRMFEGKPGRRRHQLILPLPFSPCFTAFVLNAVILTLTITLIVYEMGYHRSRERLVPSGHGIRT